MSHLTRDPRSGIGSKANAVSRQPPEMLIAIGVAEAAA
jgi:hypothetical protein